MTRIRGYHLLCCLLGLAIQPQRGALAQVVVANLVSAAGGTTTSSQFTLTSSLGQPFAGTVVGSPISEQVGFWYLPISRSVSTEITEDLDVEIIPVAFSMGDVYPNPARSSATVRFDLPRAVHVRVMVFDLRGRRVGMILDSTRPAGRHVVALNTEHLPSGTYYVRLKGEEFSGTRIVHVVR